MTGYLNQLQAKQQFTTTESEGSVAPPILLITTDMVPPEFTRPVEGFPPVQTPAMDSLKEQGIEYTQAFCTAPVCTPSRAAFLTGRYSYITTNSERAHDGHEMHLRHEDAIFPEYLKARGYYTRHHGKSHIGTAPFMKAFGENSNAWDRWSPPWYDDDQYLAYLRNQNLGPFDFKKAIRGVAPNGVSPGNNYGGWIADQNGAPFPIEGTYPFFLVHKAIESIKSYRASQARSSKPKPLYLQLDFFAPHQPFAIPGGMEAREAQIRSQIDLSTFPLKPFFPEPRVYSLYRKNWGLVSDQTISDYLVANILQWEVVDQALARLFNFLRSVDLWDPAWIFFLADHGEMNCHSRLIDKGAYLNPQVLRVPLYAKVPGSASGTAPLAGRACPVPVSLVDLAATIFDLTGIAPSEKIDGVSLRETLRQGKREAALPVMFEIWSHVVPNPCVGQVLATDDGQPVVYSYNACDPVDELYVLNSENGGELANRVSEDRDLHKKAIRSLYQALNSDPRFKAYAGFMALEYSDIIQISGDLQKFVETV